MNAEKNLTLGNKKHEKQLYAVLNSFGWLSRIIKKTLQRCDQVLATADVVYKINQS